MSKSKIAASMMCADLLNLKDTIKIFENENVEYLHIDVMDGEFVPNFGLGVDYIRGLRELMHIAKLNGRLCGAKRPHSVSEQPNFYQSLQSNPYNDSSHPSGGE